MVDQENIIWTVTEYVPGGTLGQYVISRNGKLSEAQAQFLFRDLCNALKVLSDNNIVHRDIKPDNILLTNQSEFPNLKLADLGLSKNLSKCSPGQSTVCGTKNYQAPEV